MNSAVEVEFEIGVTRGGKLGGVLGVGWIEASGLFPDIGDPVLVGVEGCEGGLVIGPGTDFVLGIDEFAGAV